MAHALQIWNEETRRWNVAGSWWLTVRRRVASSADNRDRPLELPLNPNIIPADFVVACWRTERRRGWAYGIFAPFVCINADQVLIGSGTKVGSAETSGRAFALLRQANRLSLPVVLEICRRHGSLTQFAASAEGAAIVREPLRAAVYVYGTPAPV